MKPSNKIISEIKNWNYFEDENFLKLQTKCTDLKSQGFISKKLGLEILRWKSPRPTPHYLSNTNDRFEKITKLSLETEDDCLKVHILTALKGVKIPAASALLMFYDHDKFPVIDIRVWQQLLNFKLIKSKNKKPTFDLEHWQTYLSTMRSLAKICDLPLRHLEKSLFEIHKIKQKGPLY